LASSVPATNGYPHLVISMTVLAFGMGLVMAPATESIMGSLPRSKAGVGSAMNDTTRQMGGAVGVAVLGSIFAVIYGHAIRGSLGKLHLSPKDIDRAAGSVGGAFDVAARLPAGLRRQVIAVAQNDFVHGFSSASKIGALVILMAAGIVFGFLPARASDAREPVEGALDGIASLTFAEAEGVLEADAAEVEAEAAGVQSVDDLDPAAR